MFDLINDNEIKNIILQSKDALPPPYNRMVGMDGFDALCALMDAYGGTSFYLPDRRFLFRRCLEDTIRREYDGENFRFLQRKYGYSESYLRKLLRRGKR
jgi:Mor family transcriptional regulator